MGTPSSSKAVNLSGGDDRELEAWGLWPGIWFSDPHWLERLEASDGVQKAAVLSPETHAEMCLLGGPQPSPPVGPQSRWLSQPSRLLFSQSILHDPVLWLVPRLPLPGASTLSPLPGVVFRIVC